MSEGSVNERILRIIRWNNAGVSYSWSIYAEDRHEFNKVVVKKVIWNMETDKRRMIEYIDIDPEKVLMACPDINIVSVYIDEKHSQSIVEVVKELDELAEKGIVWDMEEHPTWEWKDLDINYSEFPEKRFEGDVRKC